MKLIKRIFLDSKALIKFIIKSILATVLGSAILYVLFHYWGHESEGNAIVGAILVSITIVGFFACNIIIDRYIPLIRKIKRSIERVYVLEREKNSL